MVYKFLEIMCSTVENILEKQNLKYKSKKIYLFCKILEKIKNKMILYLESKYYRSQKNAMFQLYVGDKFRF